ncbi:hypothetical protein [Vibrio taketomensis]|uniref:hypothetical protein n=1 Tax=Vibrio taketomensis TaxID=2572923 RepID=UPI00138A670A|nr:hypothetical protein [Vibrio taketomensis]
MKNVKAFTTSNFHQAPPSLNTLIPICIDFYVQVKAQNHKSYLGTSRYRLERLSQFIFSYQVRDLSTSPQARERINSFISTRLNQVQSGTVYNDVATLQAMLNWLRRDIGF